MGIQWAGERSFVGKLETLLTSSENISPAPQMEQYEQAGVKTVWIMGSPGFPFGGKVALEVPVDVLVMGSTLI